MKIGRLAKIIDLVGKYDIETQEQLRDYLAQEGFSVTQGTVSHDIKQLNLKKVPFGDDGRQKYTAAKAMALEELMYERYLRVLREGYVGMDLARNIVVIKTVSGMAMAVAAAVDAMKWPEVAGCIAGDDTIFCALHAVEDAQEVMNRLKEMVFH